MLRYLVLVALVVVASGCSCWPQSFGQHLNNGDHVMKVEIVAQITLGWTKYYLADVLDVWATTHPHPSVVNCGRQVILRTASSSAACGVTWLQNGHVYLLNGFGSDTVLGFGIVDINSCGLVREYCSLSECEQEQLEKWVGKKCSCAYTKEYNPVCAACGDALQTFGNTGEASCQGWSVVSEGECPDCSKKCKDVQILCLWGSRRCCIDGSWQCPSGTPQLPVYSCKPCDEGISSELKERSIKGSMERELRKMNQELIAALMEAERGTLGANRVVKQSKVQP
jgi:hypothetical protein